MESPTKAEAPLFGFGFDIYLINHSVVRQYGPDHEMNQRLKYILLHRTDGLGGKLLNLISAMRIAQRYGLQVLVCWDSNDQIHDIWLRQQQIKRLFPGLTFVNNAFLDHAGHDVFIVPAKHTNYLQERYNSFLQGAHPTRTFAVGNTTEFLPLNVLNEYDLVATSCYPLMIEGEARPNFSSWEADSYRLWGNEIRSCWDTLEIHSGVTERVERFSTCHQLEEAVGLHVRRGDVEWAHQNKETVSWNASKRFIPLKAYFDVIERSFSDATLFVASDSLQVRREFQNRYPGRVVHYPVRSVARENPVTCDGLYQKVLEEELTKEPGRDALELMRMALEDSLIEILLLSKCRHLISGPSQFSLFAGCIGGMPHTMLQNP